MSDQDLTPSQRAHEWAEYQADASSVFPEAAAVVPELFLATVNTGSFAFEGLGRSVVGAHAALLAGWAAHCQDYDADWGLMANLIDRGDVTVTPIRVGQCLRDGERVA